MGLIKGTVKLEDDYEKFEKEYHEEKENLLKIFKGQNIVVEHIGSTSVNGLKAKPIIDIAIGVNKFNDFNFYKNIFRNNDNYEVRNSLDIDEILIVKGNENYTSILIHLMELESDRYKESMLFRDYLRRNKDILLEYQSLKEELALKYPDDRPMYTKSKNSFIKGVIDKARVMKLSDLKLKDITNEEYLKFYNNIKEDINYSEYLGDFTSEMINDVLKSRGKLFNYFCKQEMVCTMMYIPSTQKALDKFDLKLDFNLVAECGPIMVNSKYIGNKLQSQMLQELDNYANSLEKKYIITTIHPDNIWSINNFEKNGYKFLDTFELKRGKRNLYIKEL